MNVRGISFLRFCTDVLRITTLTAAQRVLYTVAFDGVEPCQLTGADRDLAAQLFGASVEMIPASARQVFAQRKGARVGGSRFAGLRLLHLGLTLAMRPAPGEIMTGIIVAPDLRLARQTLRYITGAVHDTPELERLIEQETSDGLILRRPDGVPIEFVCLPATQRGSAVRGRSLFGAALSEASFFRDENYIANDRDVYRPIIARIIVGGQLILESTPFSETDLLHELMEQNFNHPVSAIAAHCPTLLMRDDEHTIALVERERERDPENAATEFDAIPRGGGTTTFFDPIALNEARDVDAPAILYPLTNQMGVLGLDTGFRRDPTAATVARQNGSIIEIAECIEIRPAPGQRLVPSETLAQIIERARYHRCTSIVTDGHYIETVREHAPRIFTLVEAPAGLPGKVEVFTAARTALLERKVRIPSAHTRLINQLRAVVSKPTSGGQITITSPRRGGSHGDLASACVLAIWHAVRHTNARMPRIDLARRSRGPFNGRNVGSPFDGAEQHVPIVDRYARAMDPLRRRRS